MSFPVKAEGANDDSLSNFPDFKPDDIKQIEQDFQNGMRRIPLV